MTCLFCHFPTVHGDCKWYRGWVTTAQHHCDCSFTHLHIKSIPVISINLSLVSSGDVISRIIWLSCLSISTEWRCPEGVADYSTVASMTFPTTVCEYTLLSETHTDTTLHLTDINSQRSLLCHICYISKWLFARCQSSVCSCRPGAVPAVRLLQLDSIGGCRRGEKKITCCLVEYFISSR